MLHNTTVTAAARFALYNTVLWVVGLVAIIHLLFDYSWSLSLGYSAVTVGSYWLGQGIVTVLQKARPHSSSLD